MTDDDEQAAPLPWVRYWVSDKRTGLPRDLVLTLGPRPDLDSWGPQPNPDVDEVLAQRRPPAYPLLAGQAKATRRKPPRRLWRGSHWSA